MRCGLALSALVLLAACSGPTVNLNTPKPLEVDVTMRVDIYQHGGSPTSATAAEGGTPETRRRTRMAEIQRLKNARIVGENRMGLLSIVERPAGEYGDYVQQTVEAENADRLALMKQLASQRRDPLAVVEAEQARLWRDRAFPGEWIEVQLEDGRWDWVQKTSQAATSAPDVNEPAVVAPPEKAGPPGAAPTAGPAR